MDNINISREEMLTLILINIKKCQLGAMDKEPHHLTN